MPAFLRRLVSPERLLFAALVGSVLSLVLRSYGAINPGPPEISILESRTVPFFNHMIVCGYATVIAWLGGQKFDAAVRRRPEWVATAIIASTIGAGLVQWFFPNFF